VTGGSKERIRQALTALEALGLPREQRNERSALALLALLGITRRKGWADATSPLLGVTPIMAFAHREYGAKYAPNTRETFRRFTLHQFVEAGLVVANPDKPDRPTNSPKYCYQIDPDALKLLRRVGKRGWTHALRAYLAKHATLASTYAQQREMLRIPVFATAGGRAIKLTPGGQSPLIRAVVDEFCQRFTPGASILYIGDTGRKWAHFAQADLAALGVVVETHGKMPDVVVHYADKNWLVLIEAVTSHGPVNPKRLNELKRLFRGSNAGLVFVTAFSDRPAFMKYLSDIAWETEVWVASSPDHMIHFNGERFLGPY
jgi:hypothetical protein